MNSLQIEDRRKLVEICYRKNIGHISSSLAFIDCWHVFNKLADKNGLIIGNANTPVIFNKFFDRTVDDLCNDESLYPNMNCTPCNFTSISLGNTLGIAAGIALSKKYTSTYITIGDSIIHSGTELEAALYIGLNYSQMSKIVLFINANNCGCISTFNRFDFKILDIFKTFGWNTYSVDGHDYDKLESVKHEINISKKPICIVCRTIKGYGIKFIENDIKNWHYRILSEDTYIKALIELK